MVMGGYPLSKDKDSESCKVEEEVDQVAVVVWAEDIFLTGTC